MYYDPETMKAVAGMLTENTGKSVMGCEYVYGAQYEQHKDKSPEDFSKEPLVQYEFLSEGSILVSVNIFHFLCSNYIHSPEMNNLFKNYVENIDEPSPFYKEEVEDFTDFIQTDCNKNVKDFYGGWENTYNYDNNLSQDYMFAGYIIDGILYEVIMTHNGCDIRGGYSYPVWFRVEEKGSDTVRFQCACNVWDTEELEEFPFIYIPDTLEDDDTEDRFCERLHKEAEILSPKVLYIDSLGNGFCPLCGNILEAEWGE